MGLKGTVKTRHSLRMAEPLQVHSGWTDLIEMSEALGSKNPPWDSAVGKVKFTIPPDAVTS